MAAVADLALARDLLAVTQRFREAGARDHAVHGALARLQRGAAAQGLESFVELKASAAEGDASVATLTLCWEHFLLDVPLCARAEKGNGVFGPPELTLAGEDSPAWNHSKLAPLAAELHGTLVAGEFERCCALLGTLRSWQRLLVELPPESPLRGERFWNEASAVIGGTLQVEPFASCEGLRTTLYSAPLGTGPPEDPASNRVLLRPDTAVPSGSSASLLLEFEPPLACTHAIAAELEVRASAAAAEPEAAAMASKAVSTQLELLLGHPHATAPAKTMANEIGPAAIAISVPLAHAMHRQQWQLSPSEARGRLVRRLPLPADAAKLKSVLPPLLRSARSEACFARVWRSVWDEELLTSTGVGASGASMEYLIQLEAAPPETLRVRLALPLTAKAAASSGGSTLAPVVLSLQLNAENRNGGESAVAAADTAPRWSAQVLCGASCGEHGVAITGDYVAGLLNASHSLPLTLAYVFQRAHESAKG